MGFSPADVLMMQRRLARGSEPVDGGEGVETGTEVDNLHAPALRWLRERGLAYSYNRPDKRSTATPGAPDLAVCTLQGTVWIEFKTRTGKLSEDQQTWHFLAARQGVQVQTVRNFDDFLKVMQSCGVESKSIPNTAR